jgi:NAD(P)-dependent dehydrogenase (short-subunit alcohol dehydrogenase family)
MLSTTVLPAMAAANYYSKSSFNVLSVVAALYSAMASISIACLKPIPFLNRGLPTVREIPKTIVTAPTRIAIITGANTGIGYETAKALVERGYEVVLACRSKDKALRAIERMERELVKAPGKAVYHGTLDLSSFQSVHDFSEAVQSKYDKIDLLVNNAGINTSGPSEKGLDLCYQSNFLGHFLLTNNLIDKILQATKPRIINLSSVMHHYCHAEKHDEAYWKKNALFGMSDTSTYSASKLAALLFTIELNRRYQSRGLRSISVNPGAVNSDIWRSYPRWLVAIFDRVYLDNKQGSYTTVAASVLEDLPDDVIYLQPYHQVLGSREATPFPPFEMLGPFVGYQPIQPRLPMDGTNGVLTAQALWKVSEELCNTKMD